MTIENNIFNDAGTTPPENSGTPAGAVPGSNNDLDTLLAGIKNERGEQKYKTVNDALKALGHSQAFIPELQSKVKQTEDQMNQAAEKLRELDTLKDTVAKLTEQLTKRPDAPSGGLSEDDIAGLVDNRLAAQRAQEAAQRNTQSVIAALQKQFGEKAGDVFYGKAQELGMSQVQINALAASSPQAVLAMFGVTGGVSQKQTINPPPSTINTAGFKGTQPKSWIGREENIKPLGSTTQDMMDQMENAKRMVEEMNEKGISLHDLTNPKNFNKFFN